MGDDEDTIVLSFKVKEKQPAEDLMAFIERGYDWVLDSDTGAGDFEDGEYLVFVELERNVQAIDHILKLVSAFLNLTQQKMEDWRFQYGKEGKIQPLTKENLKKAVPTSPKVYQLKYGKDHDSDDELAALQETARVPMKNRAPKNEFTENLRIAAGLK